MSSTTHTGSASMFVKPTRIAPLAATHRLEAVRQRPGWVLAGLRHQRARESDLIYEAYYDAFHADLHAERDPGS